MLSLVNFRVVFAENVIYKGIDISFKSITHMKLNQYFTLMQEVGLQKKILFQAVVKFCKF